MKKYYAVKIGREVGVYEKWDACKASVDGYPNAKYKSFINYDEAYQFVYGDKTSNNQQKSELIAYIDGSYEDSIKTFTYAGILFLNGKRHEFAFAESNSEATLLRNVAGELKAAMYVINFALDSQVRSIDIYYDYAGIESWAIGEWKAKNAFTQNYVEFINKVKDKISLNFIKVKAHAGDKYNEEVDKLAKEALTTKSQEIINVSDNDTRNVDINEVVERIKGNKTTLNFGFLIDGKIINSDDIYSIFKRKWKDQKKKLNEIKELKPLFDVKMERVSVVVLTTAGEKEIVYIESGELNG